jgi:hypothetical protein
MEIFKMGKNNSDAIYVDLNIKDKKSVNKDDLKQIIDQVIEYVSKNPSIIPGYGFRSPDNKKKYPTYPSVAARRKETNLNETPPVGSIAQTIAGA